MGRGESPERRGRSRSRTYSREKTYSRSPRRDYGRDRDDRRFKRERSPYRGGGGGSSRPRGRYYDGREHPEPCPCLGVFGMSLHTSERDLKKIFGQYGEIESVQIVYDRYSGRSRGFGFVYFTSTRDATRAKDHMKDSQIDGMKVRVDFSVTRGGGPYAGSGGGGVGNDTRNSKSRQQRSRSRSRSRNRSRRRSATRSRSP